MPGITAILHTHNEALRIARAIESLRCCEEVLIIDHDSTDDTCRIARAFGARAIAAGDQGANFHWAAEAANDWIFCMHPAEAVPEMLEASVLEWKLEEQHTQKAFAVALLEEIPEGWVTHPPEPRLVHRSHSRWDKWKPVAEAEIRVLDGPLARLNLP